MHAANVSILCVRQDQVIEYFSSIPFAKSVQFFVLYRQIDVHAEHEEGLKDIY